MFDAHSVDEPIEPRVYRLSPNDPERFPDQDEPSEVNDDEFDDDADEDDADDDDTDDEDQEDE